MARRTKEEAEQTRNAILDAAEHVFFERGVVRTSLQEVAQAANVSRGAVYWHFRNKIELLQAMTNRIVLPQEHLLEQLETSNSPTPLDDLSHACRESLHAMVTDHRRRRIFTILTQRCEYLDEMADIIKTRQDLRDRMTGRFIRLFERANKASLLAPHWPPRLAAIALHSLMFGLIYGISACQKPDFAIDQDNAACVSAFFQSLKR